MSESNILQIRPTELTFPPSSKDVATRTCYLTNTSKESFVAFKVRTTKPERYRVRPNQGVIVPGDKQEIQVTYCRKAGEATIGDLDKFQIQAVVSSSNDPAQAIFDRTPESKVLKYRLMASYSNPEGVTDGREGRSFFLDPEKETKEKASPTSPAPVTEKKEPVMPVVSPVPKTVVSRAVQESGGHPGAADVEAKLRQISKERDDLLEELRTLRLQLSRPLEASMRRRSNERGVSLTKIWLLLLFLSFMIFVIVWHPECGIAARKHVFEKWNKYSNMF